MKRITILTSFLLLILFISCGPEKEKGIPNTNRSIRVDTLPVVLNQRDTMNEKLINFYHLKKEFSKKKQDLQIEKTSFSKYLAASISLYKDKKYAPHPEMQKLRNQIPTGFESHRNPPNITQLTAILENDTIPEIFKFPIAKGVCKKYTTSAKLDSALRCFQLIKKIFPEKKDRCLDYSFPCITKTQRFLDSLKMENIIAQKFLFLEAGAREEMIKCSCWFGESWYNLSIVKDKYQELLLKFPDSEYADDAEYWLLNYEYYGDEQGGFPISEIPKVKKFIDKYPNSNRIVELIMKIAYSYSIAYSEDIDEHLTILNKGITTLKDLKLNYPLDSLQAVHLEQTLNQYEYQRNEVLYDFTVLPKNKK